MRDFDAAVNANPTFAQAYANRALAERALGENARADADQRKAEDLKRGRN